MFTRFLAALAFVAVARAGSEVVITGQLPSPQTRPIVIPRFFKRGEITHFAKPNIMGGGVPALWQNDVKTRWRDSSASVAITGASNTSPIRITAVSHGFKEREQVSIAGIQGNLAANGVDWTIRNVSVDGFDLVNSHGSGEYAPISGTVVGPAFGSLKYVLISFNTIIPTSPGSITVLFLNDSNQCSSGDTATCEGEGLDSTGMLTFNGGTWAATTGTLQASTAYTANARTMLTDGAFRYWMRGPVSTVVIAEDATVARPYDFGYACTANCTGNYSTATWAADPTNRSLHPIFVLSFFTSWAGVKIEFILENEWSTALQDQRYDLTLSTSAGAVLTSTGQVQYGRTRWRRKTWDGNEPGGAGNERLGIEMNLGLAYMMDSKVIHAYDQTLDPSGSVAGHVSTFNANQTAGKEGLDCPTATTCGNTRLNMGNTGDRGDIGPVTAWDVAYLYVPTPAMLRVAEGNGDIVGLMPIHIREIRSDKAAYDLAGTVPSLGRNISMDSLKTFSFSNLAAPSTSAADRITPLVTLSSSFKWQLDTSHYPNNTEIPYLATGDWWHYSNLVDSAHLHVGWNLADNTAGGLRYKQLGLPAQTSQTRGVAWSLGQIFNGALHAVDGSPEQNYLQQKWNNWIAFEDGALNNTASRFYDPGTLPFSLNVETSPWALGRGMLKGMFLSGGLTNPLGVSPGYGECSEVPSNLDPTVIPSVAYCGRPFMWYFMTTSWLKPLRLGEPVAAFRDAQAPFVIQQLMDPAANMYGTIYYGSPIRNGAYAWPTLTAPITTNFQLVFQVSSVPVEYQNPPYIVVIDSEYIKICSVDVMALTITACPNAVSGRGFWGVANPSSHITGRPVQIRRPFQTWASLRTGFSNPETSAWDFGTNADRYANYLNGAASAFYYLSSGGYSGAAAYNVIHGAWAINPVAVATSTLNPKMNMVPSIDDPLPLIVTTPELPDGGVGTPYSTTLTASGGTLPYTWALTVGMLPGGLSLDPDTGVISGTPTTVGSSSFTVRATDALMVTATRPLTVDVAQLIVTTVSPLPEGAFGIPYSLTFTASGGTGPYTWAVHSGSLPTGLSLASNGNLTGTPTLAGTSNFTVRATDSAGMPHTADLPATLVISPAPPPNRGVTSSRSVSSSRAVKR